MATEMRIRDHFNLFSVAKNLLLQGGNPCKRPKFLLIRVFKQFMVTFRKKIALNWFSSSTHNFLLPKGKGKECDPNLQKLVTGHLEKQRNSTIKSHPIFER